MKEKIFSLNPESSQRVQKEFINEIQCLKRSLHCAATCRPVLSVKGGMKPNSGMMCQFPGLLPRKYRL